METIFRVFVDQGPDPSVQLPSDAPPSVRLVTAFIGTASTSRRLQERTGLPSRTVRFALRWLDDRGLIRRRAHLADARRSLILPAGGLAQHVGAVERAGFAEVAEA